MSAPSVLMLSPGFPDDMPWFTRGLAAVGARVYGVGDQPVDALPPAAREALSDYRQVGDLWNADALTHQIRDFLGGRALDAIHCLWEPGIEVVAALREALGIPGMRREQAAAFRDKEHMKRVLDGAGIRTPWHTRAHTKAEVWAAAERAGYPLIVKPIAGAGSADTWKVGNPGELEEALRHLEHVPEVSVEEFIQGEELTFDTICAAGRPLFYNVSWYRPKPLIMRQNEWVSPVSITLRDPHVPSAQVGVDLGHRVLGALGFDSGFTHMEWFLTPSGEAVFGEIGARSPGGRLVHSMNYSVDADLFAGWAEAVCYGHLSQDLTKRYNVGSVFKRASGQGSIQRIDGLDSLFGRFGEHIVLCDLNRVGQPRRDYQQVVEGDGWIVVRHPDFDSTVAMTEAIANDLRMFAG